MKKTHDALPWALKDGRYLVAPIAGNKRDAELIADFFGESATDHGNAEFAHHACNSHYELLAALEKSEQRIIQLCGTVNTLSAKLGLGQKVRADDFADVARAAIAKAKGGSMKIIQCMPKPTHSPAPWRMHLGQVLDADGNALASIYTLRDDQDAVNARLMLAAPVLLRACVLALGRDDVADGELGDVLRAAISEALDLSPARVPHVHDFDAYGKCVDCGQWKVTP